MLDGQLTGAFLDMIPSPKVHPDKVMISFALYQKKAGIRGSEYQPKRINMDMYTLFKITVLVYYGIIFK